MKVRTIITQDAEVDDQNSLRHFLFYANEVELLGIVQTSSKFHWKGAQTPAPRSDLSWKFLEENIPFDRPYRWTGTDWMFQVVEEYAADYPSLSRHAEGYPTPEQLRALVKIGNIGYMGDVSCPTEGSECIRKAILDDDPRPLYLQVWGGCNTIARALMDIQAAYENKPEWPGIHAEISRKVVLTACGEQDETYRSYLAEQWPDILFVKTLQMGSYAYPWKTMPEGESKDSLTSAFMRREILSGKSALVGGYCTWMDGKEYEGENRDYQFGANPNIAAEWFGVGFGLPAPEKYEFLSEGDSPTFFPLLNWGFRTLESFSYGGMAGRYRKVCGEKNAKGEELNYWETVQDIYIDKYGQEHWQESMWKYVADIQRDFAARIGWCSCASFTEGEHAPSLTIQEGLDVSSMAGGNVTLHAVAASPDGAAVTVSFEIYREASGVCAKNAVLTVQGAEAALTVPADATPGEQIYVVVKAQAAGRYRLTHYQQVIVTVRSSEVEP